MKRYIGLVLSIFMLLSGIPVVYGQPELGTKMEELSTFNEQEEEQPLSFDSFPLPPETVPLSSAEVTLRAEAETALQAKTVYSELSTEERLTVNEAYCLNQEYMQGWEDEGYTVSESVPLAQMMQNLFFTKDEVKTLISAYGGVEDAKLAADSFFQYTFRYDLIPEEYVNQKTLFLQGFPADTIFSTYAAAEELGAELADVFAVQETEMSAGDLSQFNVDDRQMLLDIASVYHLKLTFLTAYLAENNLTVTELLSKLPSQMQLLSASDDDQGFDEKTYPISPFTAEGMTVSLKDGDVMFQNTDVVIPGKNGMDLAIGARYNSAEGKKGVFAYTLGGMSGGHQSGVNRYAQYHVTALNDFAYGWGFNFSRIYRPGIESYRILQLSDGRSYTIQTNPQSTNVTLVGYGYDDLTMKRNYSHNTASGSTTYAYAVLHSDGKKEFFNSDGTLNKIVDRFENAITFTYNSLSNISITDTFGRVTTIVKTDNAVTVTLPDTNTIVYNLVDATVYNAEGASETFKNVGSITNQEGITTQFTYYNGVGTFNFFHNFTNVDPFEFSYSRMQKVDYPTGASSECAFNVTSDTLIEGSKTITRATNYKDTQDGTDYNTAAYESFTTTPRVVNYAYGKKGSYWISSDGSITREIITDADDNQLKYVNTSYKSKTSLPTQITTRFGENTSKTRVQSFVYDDYCRKTAETDGQYHATYTYGANDLMLTKTYQQDADTTILQENTLDADGKNIIKTTVKVNGVLQSETDYEYDSFGNLTKETKHPASGVNIITEYAYTYNADGSYTVTQTVKNVSDADGQNAADLVTVAYYDVMGRVINQTDAKNASTTYTYDDMGRVLTQTAPDNTVTSNAYNTTQNYIITTMPNGSKTKYQYDKLGNISSESVLIGETWQPLAQFTYDLMCRRSTITEIRSAASGSTPQEAYTTHYAYDVADRILSQTVKQGETVVSQTEYAYDETSSTTSNFVTQTITGDATITPAVRKTENDLRGVKKAEYVYNGPEQYLKTEYTYDYLDNILTVKDDKARDKNKPFTTQYEYDYAGRVTSETDIDGNTKTTGYDWLGRKTSESDFMDNVVTYTYDAASRVVKTVMPFHGNETTQKKTYYDANGNVVKELSQVDDTKYSVTQNEYDSMNRVTKVKTYPELTATAQPVGPADLVQYTYDSMGNPLTMTIATEKAGVTDTSTTTYEYNSLGQCVKITDALNQAEEFMYNLAGDVVQKTDRSGTDISYTYNYWSKPLSMTAANEGTTQSVTYTYDILGNRKTMTDASGTTSYSYDFMGRLTNEEGNGKLKTYTYDKQGNRTGLTVTEDGATL